MDKEWLLKHTKVQIQCKVDALSSVNKMDLPKEVIISDTSFSGLGLKTSRAACKELERLREVYGDKLPYLIGLSLREIWFSLFDGSSYIALMVVEGDMADNDHTQRLSSAVGYGEYEGIAWTLYNHLSELTVSQQQMSFRNGSPFEERVPLVDLLNGAAMYWFAAAATARRSGDLDGTLDCLFEAQDALSLAHGNHMWDEGIRIEREEIAPQKSADALAAARSALAKAAAQARHSENREMKAEVFTWLDVNMPSYKSMDAAAQAIIRQQPIAFRTARDWVGDWKKLRAAGT
jgi:hypothetical protein